MHALTAAPDRTKAAETIYIPSSPKEEFSECGRLRIVTWRASAAESGLTLEQYLRKKGCSHRLLTHLKRTQQGIQRNRIPAYTNQRVNCGDEITIRVVECSSSEQIVPTALPLSIVYEDEDLLVVDKPSDMPVHPSINNHENTLANAVMHYYESQGISLVFRCINRLDRDTSGLVLIAKNMLSSAMLSQMSASRLLHREYLAIVEGELPQQGTINAPIARKEGSALMRCINPVHGEAAVTHYRRLAFFQKRCVSGQSSHPDALPKANSGKAMQAEFRLPDSLSLAAVRLETGRTHQIRVHMGGIGHPLPGDFLYYPESVSELTPRQMLHSYRLSFTHPVNGEQLHFESQLPPDMRRLLAEYEPVKIAPG